VLKFFVHHVFQIVNHFYQFHATQIHDEHGLNPMHLDFCPFNQLIPSNLRAVDGSAFCDVNLSTLSIESGNQRFVFENNFLIDAIDHILVRNFSTSSHIEIPCDIEIFGSSCFQ
jgi:hypothetical protein